MQNSTPEREALERIDELWQGVLQTQLAASEVGIEIAQSMREGYAAMLTAELRAALAQAAETASAIPTAEALLREAAEGLLSRMTDTYQARNGRRVGIQGDDGEKCWIVHSDDIDELRRALATPPASTSEREELLPEDDLPGILIRAAESASVIPTAEALLREAVLQLEYLDGRHPTGTTPATIAKINAFLATPPASTSEREEMLRAMAEVQYSWTGETGKSLHEAMLDRILALRPSPALREALEALSEITKYPTCNMPVVIAMTTLDRLGVAHRKSPSPPPAAALKDSDHAR